MKISSRRVKQLLSRADKIRILVVGDVMLDHFVWGEVTRISPEAPVPVVDVIRENYMPGGAANIAHNLTALNANIELFGVVGRDIAASQLKGLLSSQRVNCSGLVSTTKRHTSIKTRIVAQQQQVARLDRETRQDLSGNETDKLIAAIRAELPEADAVIVGDYGKGVVTQPLLDELKTSCRKHGVWLSLDPKPVHRLNLTGMSLITPNRKEAFDLTHIPDETRNDNPLEDKNLMLASERLLSDLRPAVLLITLGASGMLLCQRGQKPLHIPTVAQEVFDVSGAGDTVIAAFTLAIAAGASPVEAAILANQAGGIVVGKMGTSTVTQRELLEALGVHILR